MSQRRAPGDALVAAGIGVAVAAAALLAMLGSDVAWTLRGDNKLGILPMSFEVFRHWSAGALPKWTSGQWGGFPLLVDPQAGVFYLPYMFGFLFTNPPHLRALDLSTALHAGWMAAGFFLWLRRIGSGRASAAAATIVMLVSSQMMWWTSFLTAYASLCWWPWTLLAAEALGDPGRPGAKPLAFGAITLAAQAYAGFIEYAFYGGCLAGLWIVARPGAAGLPVRVGRAAALGVLALLLAAPQLLPSALDLPHTHRATEPDHQPFLAVSYARGAALLDPRSGASLGGLSSPFLGPATLALAAYALLRRTRYSRRLSGLALLGALLAAGTATPLYGALAALPVFELFRGPFKFYVITQICVISLAALGSDRLLRSGRRQLTYVGLGIAAVVAVEHGLHLAHQVPALSGPHTPHEARVPEALEELDPWLPELTSPPSPGAPAPRILRAQGFGAFGSLGMLVGLEELRGGPVTFYGTRHARLLHPYAANPGLLFLSRAHLDLYGVAFVVVPGACTLFPGRGLQVVEARPDSCLLRNPSGPQRYAIPERVRPVANEAAMLRIVQKHADGPVPIVAAGETIVPVDPAVDYAGEVTLHEHGPGHAALEVSSDVGAWLLVRESWNAGWQAWVDGRSAEIHPAAGLFFALAVPAGRHEVALRYRPRGLGAGLACAGIGLAFAVACLRPSKSREIGDVPENST